MADQVLVERSELIALSRAAGRKIGVAYSEVRSLADDPAAVERAAAEMYDGIRLGGRSWDKVPKKRREWNRDLAERVLRAAETGDSE